MYERSVFLPDLHVPFVDGEAFRVALAVLKYFDPHHVFILGDVCDFYSLSTFDRDPERRFNLQDDLDQTFVVLKRIRLAAPNAQLTLLKGNHEHRLQRFLMRSSPELWGLRSLSLPRLLSLDQLDIKWIEEGLTRFHGFLIKHGNLIRNRSGYTATGEMEKSGISGVSAHTHRLGQVFKSNYGGMSTWVEAGCLCFTDPDHFDYLEGQVPDWQIGCAVGYFERGGNRFSVSPIPIVKYKAVLEGKEIVA